VMKAALFNGEPVPVVQSAAVVCYEREFKGIQLILLFFPAPMFISPEKVKIFYKLEGYEADWQVIQPFQERTVFYKDPGPGRYRFRVTAANSDGIRNPGGAYFDFTLKLYFYQTLWFKIFGVLLVILSGLALYFGTRRYLYVRKLRNKYKNSTLDPEKAESALKKLRVLLESDKIFRDETLSLNSLASKLNIAPRYLSQIMNEQLDKSFWALINGYRVEEAKKMLAETGKRDFSIMEIAFEVGFNSKEAFNRAFKKYTGVTPSQFRGSR
ncbi:MAG: helix-turn-helix domain-containing protein, partial [bacterium]|nr:helix-turn-helix domain-containing protein [bacterium]